MVKQASAQGLKWFQEQRFGMFIHWGLYSILAKQEWIMHVEQIPVDHSAALYRAARMPRKRLIALPGGHHRSIQHDPEMQGESLRFVEKAFAARG